MASLSIAIRSAPVPVAPAGIWVEAIDLEGFDVPGLAAPGKVYDPSFHEITFAWSVQGAPLAPYTAPGNLLPEWRDANRAYGKIAALFFPEPGQYTIKLHARDRSGMVAEAALDITILKADAAYPGTATVCVSSDPDETWIGAPADARRVSNLSQLQSALRKASKPTRLLFRRGLEYRGISMRINRAQLSHIDAWGDGAQPILRPSEDGSGTMFALWNRVRMDQFTVANIVFRGAWNAATETGFDTPSPLTWRQSRTACHYAVWNCVFDGFERLHFAPGDTVPSRILVGNSVVTNWRNYGFLFRSSAARFALVGCQVAQHVEALHGDRKVGALSNNHGPLRIADCAEVYIGASDFFSRTGWSPLAGEVADQPCLRLNSSGTRGRSYNLDRIVCEGGTQMVNMAGSNQRTQENPGNYLVDKAVLIATAKSVGPFVAVSYGGVTLRNILGVLPDTPRRHPIRWSGAIRVGMSNPGPGNEAAPLAAYSSTFLNLLTGDNRIGRGWVLEEGAEVFENATLENLILFGPDRTDGLDLGSVLPGIVPRFRGVRYNFGHQTGTLSAAVRPGEGFVVPYDDITEARVDQTEAPATSQAYWEAYAARDRWHMLHIEKVKGTLYAAGGDFLVRFDTRDAVITNTGKKAWPAGADWTLSLDRTTRLPPMDTRYASPESLPLPRPVPPTYATEGRGLFAADDLFMTPRGAAPSRGAVEPS